MNEIKNNNESVNLNKKSEKKGKIILISVSIILLMFMGIILYFLLYKVPENQYFIQYRYDYNTKTETSTIYCYDAEENEVYEIGSINGYMRRGVVNEEQTQLIGILDGGIVLYDLDNGSVIKSVADSELENRLGVQPVAHYLWSQYDFTDDGEGIYITMNLEDNYQVYLYYIETDELNLVIEGVDFEHSEYVGKYIYYIDYVDETRTSVGIKRYHMETCEIESLVSFSAKIDAFAVSPDGEKILINAREERRDKLYMYDIEKDTLQVVQRGYYFSDIAWNGDSYIYVEEYWGIIADVNPAIKVDNGFLGPNKVIYRVEGLLKGGNLYLIENP